MNPVVFVINLLLALILSVLTSTSVANDKMSLSSCSSSYLDGQEVLATDILQRLGYDVSEVGIDVVEFLRRLINVFSTNYHKSLPTITEIETNRASSEYSFTAPTYSSESNVGSEWLNQPYLYPFVLIAGGGWLGLTHCISYKMAFITLFSGCALLGYEKGRQDRQSDATPNALLNIYTLWESGVNSEDNDFLNESDHNLESGVGVTEPSNYSLFEMCSPDEKQILSIFSDRAKTYNHYEGMDSHVSKENHKTYIAAFDNESLSVDDPDASLSSFFDLLVKPVEDDLSSSKSTFVPPDHPIENIDVLAAHIKNKMDQDVDKIKLPWFDINWMQFSHTMTVHSLWALSLLPCVGFTLNKYWYPKKKNIKNEGLQHAVAWGGCVVLAVTTGTIGDVLFSYIQKNEPHQEKSRKQKMKPSKSKRKARLVQQKLTKPHHDNNGGENNNEKTRIVKNTIDWLWLINTGFFGAGCECETVALGSMVCFVSDTVDSSLVKAQMKGTAVSTVYYRLCSLYTDSENWGWANVLNYIVFLGSFLYVYSSSEGFLYCHEMFTISGMLTAGCSLFTRMLIDLNGWN